MDIYTDEVIKKINTTRVLLQNNVGKEHDILKAFYVTAFTDGIKLKDNCCVVVYPELMDEDCGT